ncbi:beta-mannosidase [Flavivirga eckloniae]|uniref:Beta-mannosidase B n=1 Tax=Flavivirga eckloniae TaxID=1803846 RepID=A0A2K9PLA6_9FLAO|nr:glycoside hydrolase family 2 protein [Flavivirga eckloniae]AUP77840.1 beta-mannosidase [Flavivirga eckloniae]
MKYPYFYIVLSIIMFNCQPKEDIPKKITLHENWSFKNTTDTTWLNAKVPGDAHSDLFSHKLIEDPFVKDNEFKLQWISEKDWEYKTTFTLDEKTLQKKHLDLHFEGLDTYASVYVNDSLILNTNNAFRKWEVNVKPFLKLENHLKIVFENTTTSENKEKAKLPYELPAGNRIFTRKAQFQYGWDWGPIFNTSGIWRPIYLKAWNDLKIKDVFVQQNHLNDSIASLTANIEYKYEAEENLLIDIYVNNKLNKTYNTQDTSVFTFEINNPKRWWTHNLGEPYLYDLKFVLRNKGKILDAYSLKKGLRTIDLIAEKDSIGQSFYFKLNDVPVFMKGANYIPQNSFQNQVTDAHYNTLLNSVTEANMNMLRIWGGGIYENDIFYDLCDEKGVLVWQDFMFACAMYPGDKDFLNNVKQEAIDNIIRLRNHASIALWCGNNENDEAWHNWGWQEDRSESEKEEIWSNYLKVFDDILPSAVNQFSDKTPYWASSPLHGRSHPKFLKEGDAHDWWIWHNAYPFEHLEDNVPRFMSEFGFQSFPSYEAIKYATQKDSIDISSDAFATHQKHPRGFKLIKEYMERDFPIPTNDEDYVYMSQVLQAYGMTKGFEAQRRAMPYNMGTLYWQLNDCWPVASWSSLDNFGNWKALHYRTKKSFEDVLISSRLKNDTIKTFVINDKLKEIQGKLDLKLIDFSGNTVWSDSLTITAKANTSEKFYNLPLKDIDITKTALVANFNESSSIYYLTKPKDLRLLQGDIDKKVIKTESGFSIELSSKVLQKDVFLFTNEKGFFNDNFFDLLPHETKVVTFKTESQSIDDLDIKTLNHFIE